MGLLITKNTIGSGINNILKNNGPKMNTAVTRALEAIRSATLPFVPVVSGTLKRSLASSTDENTIYDVSESKFLGFTIKVTGTIGSKVEYAPYVEYGTSRFAGRYYLTQGINNSADNVRKIIINTMKS